MRILTLIQMIFVEVIANPSMAMPDLLAVISVAEKHNVKLFFA